LKRRVEDIIEMKRRGERIVMLTAYDYITAKIMSGCGVDMILVGDSLAMVFFGYDTTRKVTMEDMLHHTRAVANGSEGPLVVGDMPYRSYDTPDLALENARRFIQAGADAVKVEGKVTDVVEKLVGEGISVMGHIGLTPQTITRFRVQGRDEESAQRLLEDALALEKAGCFSIVLECIPMDLASRITSSLEIPTIGIGAGPYCDGQVLVSHDMLGLFERFKPKFVKRYAHLSGEMERAFREYVREVKEGIFPDEEHSYR